MKEFDLPVTGLPKLSWEAIVNLAGMPLTLSLSPWPVAVVFEGSRVGVTSNSYGLPVTGLEFAVISKRNVPT
jgi:hypothetical protein